MGSSKFVPDYGCLPKRRDKAAQNWHTTISRLICDAWCINYGHNGHLVVEKLPRGGGDLHGCLREKLENLQEFDHFD